jgi:hypothetical protein
LKKKKNVEVSKILDSRVTQKKLEFFVQWQGYDITKRTWEPIANLRNAPKMNQNFFADIQKNPNSKDA